VANVVVSEWTFWIACYGALVATGSLSWSVVKHFIDQSEKSKERKKIVVQFGIPIIKKNVPKIGEMYVFPRCVVNFGQGGRNHNQCRNATIGQRVYARRIQ
jgi:hypothetical protein